MWLKLKIKQQFSHNLKFSQYLFSFTLNSLWRKINVEIILKLWENYCFIFNFNHILKFKNFRVWQNYPLKRNLVPRFTRLARDKGLGGYHPTHVNFLHDHLFLQYMLKHASLFSATHIKHFMVTQSNFYFNHPFFPRLRWPICWSSSLVSW